MDKKYFLLFLIGILLGILLSQSIIPKLEALFFSILSPAERPPQILREPAQKKEIEIFCQKIQKRRGVEVDLSQQKLRICEKGKAIEEFRVSTGKKETPTPTGEFKVIYKTPLLYSTLVESWLPFWVGFYRDYGFHELPISKEKAERIGEDKIGQPDSIGCIRLNVGDAERFYHWAEIGMRIIIFGQTPIAL